jgi:uncharacterized protein
MRSLKEILQSTSDVLFPAELGERRVEIDSTDCNGDTPLHVVLWRKDTLAVEHLIAAGAAVNAIGDMGETPLHVAVSQDLPGAVAALLEAGANPDIRCEFGDTPRQRAEARGRELALLFGGGA